jgi:hypothetical protein
LLRNENLSNKNKISYTFCISLQICAGDANRQLSMLVTSFEKKYIPVSCVNAESVVGHYGLEA